MTRYAMFRLDFDGIQQERLGEVELDAQNDIHLLAAEGEAREEIMDAIEELNGKPVLFLKEPPEDDMPRHSISKKAVERTHPDFMDALQDNLARWHSMVLVTEKSQ